MQLIWPIDSKRELRLNKEANNLMTKRGYENYNHSVIEPIKSEVKQPTRLENLKFNITFYYNRAIKLLKGQKVSFRG